MFTSELYSVKNTSVKIAKDIISNYFYFTFPLFQSLSNIYNIKPVSSQLLQRRGSKNTTARRARAQKCPECWHQHVESRTSGAQSN